MSIHAMIPTNNFFFNDGEHEKTINWNNTCNDKLLVKYNGLKCDTKNITLEFSLFPFLCLHGHGGYDGKIPLHEY